MMEKSEDAGDSGTSGMAALEVLVAEVSVVIVEVVRLRVDEKSCASCIDFRRDMLGVDGRGSTPASISSP